MDRLRREGNPPTGQLASPVPQYKDTVLNAWAELQGEGGASYVKDRDALAKLEQARVLLAGVATETKLEEARALLESVAGKDFATQATLAQVKSELELVKAELATIKANQLSGDQKVQLSSNIVTTRSELSVVGIAYVGKKVSKTLGGAQPLRLNKSYTIQITNNFDVASRNGVRVVFTDGTSGGLQRIELPNLPAGASLVLRLSRYLAPDNEALVQVPPLCGNDFFITLDITSTAVGKWDVVVSEED
jgi:hypothetical protein